MIISDSHKTDSPAFYGAWFHQRLAAAGRPIAALLQGNRPDCLCYQSRDIGTYDTCPHGYVYCYVVQHREMARWRFAAHDPEGEFLFSPRHAAPQECSSA